MALFGLCELWDDELAFITSSIASYANAIGAQSQELSCNETHTDFGW